MIEIKNFSRKDLKGLLTEKNYPAYTAGQIFQWIYRHRREDIADMTNIASSNRRRLKEEFSCSHLPILQTQTSRDGTIKFLFGLGDRETIETVLIPEGKRNTLCVSTQVGCSRGCRFCVSGALGLSRNLSASEIVNQYLGALDTLSGGMISNIVFMGAGEPLDNLDNLIKSIAILQDPQGPGFTARKTCVSTIGVIPAIARLNRMRVRFKLSVSLHCADEKKRNDLMPATKKYPLAELIPQLRIFSRNQKMPVTFEYILIDGLNCGDTDARALIRLARKLPSKINLIPYNRSEHFPYTPPAYEDIERFENMLKRHDIPCTLRKPRGQDINAACGQLKAEFAESPRKGK